MAAAAIMFVSSTVGRSAHFSETTANTHSGDDVDEEASPKPTSQELVLVLPFYLCYTSLFHISSMQLHWLLRIFFDTAAFARVK